MRQEQEIGRRCDISGNSIHKNNIGDVNIF